jgi:hypothetical protein
MPLSLSVRDEPTVPKDVEISLRKKKEGVARTPTRELAP